MSELIFSIERVEDGHAKVRVFDTDLQSGERILVWSCEVVQEWTKEAQRAALKATLNYLNSYIDLSEGGQHL